MAQSWSQIYMHLVFSTKGRAAFLRDKSFRGRVHAYLVGICRNHHSSSIIIGGVEDHVHVLCRLAKTITVSDLVRKLKRDSSKWIKVENPALNDFHWQQGYGAFSLSPSHVEILKQYIVQQAALVKPRWDLGIFVGFCNSGWRGCAADPGLWS